MRTKRETMTYQELLGLKGVTEVAAYTSEEMFEILGRRSSFSDGTPTERMWARNRLIWMMDATLNALNPVYPQAKKMAEAEMELYEGVVLRSIDHIVEELEPYSLFEKEGDEPDFPHQEKTTSNLYFKFAALYRINKVVQYCKDMDRFVDYISGLMLMDYFDYTDGGRYQ